jgi:release factor glutamine methyltransferase
VTSSLDQATIGGPEGFELSERFLVQARNHLNNYGRIYLVCSSLADTPKIRYIMKTLGFNVRVAASKKLFYEELYILEGSFQK